MTGSAISREYCAQVFDDIAAKFEEYERNSRYQDALKSEICTLVQKFRQQLRKSHKKLRKGSSNLQRGCNDNYDEEDDSEAIIAYLEIVNDFIKANI